MTNEQQVESRSVNVRRGSYDSLDIYEITKDELEILKQGSPNSTFLNFSIALFSIFLSLGGTLLTVKIELDRIFYIFVILVVISGISGIIVTILWLKGENIFKKTIKKIEGRMICNDIKETDETSIELSEQKS